MDIEQARKLLYQAGVFFDDIDDDDWDEELDGRKQMLNMNDVFGWALAFGEYVPDKELPEVGRLFVSYGFCGLCYWVSEQNGQIESEFYDITRMIQFVRQEEKVRNTIKSCNQRAYFNIRYKLGKSYYQLFKRWMRITYIQNKIKIKRYFRKP